MTAMLAQTTNPVPGSISSSQMFLTLVGIAVIIFGAYYVTALVAKRTGRMQQGRAVRILDRFGMGKDKAFCLLEMGDKLYLVAMSEGAITVVDTLTGEAAEAVRRKCSQAQATNPVMRGASFITARTRGKPFDSHLESARRRIEQEEAQSSDDEPDPGLAFAREEDDIDAMLRQISARKRRKPGSGEGGEEP